MKALVLSSGGVDSTTCLGLAIEKYGKEKLITQGCYNNLYIDKDEYDNLHIIAKADGIASFKIEYCPFCGRKLSEV